MLVGTLTLPEGVELLVTTHSHDLIVIKIRYKCRYGAIG